jgi:hypothetical protein
MQRFFLLGDVLGACECIQARTQYSASKLASSKLARLDDVLGARLDALTRTQNALTLTHHPSVRAWMMRFERPEV